MQGSNTLTLMLSVDFLYLSTFICLAYIVGLYAHSRSFQIKDFNSAEVCIPWFIVISLFTAPTLSQMTHKHIHFYTFAPLVLVIAGCLAYVLIKGAEPIDRYYLKTIGSAFVKPTLSLISMYILRDFLHLPFQVVAVMAFSTYAFLLYAEISRERSAIIPTGLLHNIIALALITISLKTLFYNHQAHTFPTIAASVFSMFTVILYNSDKFTKRSTTDVDAHLISKFAAPDRDRQFEVAIDISEDGLWEYNFESDTMQISRQLRDWLCNDGNFIPHAADFWINRVHPQDWSKLPESWIPEDFSMLREKIRALSGKDISFEIRLRDKSGVYKWVRVHLKVTNKASKTTLNGSFKDVDHEKHANAQINQLSLYDATTRLPNISSMLSQLNAALKDGKEHVILSINIDNFKMINDLMGFFTGDKLLAKVGRSLAERLPGHAHLYRFGGDEFVVLTNAPSEATALVKTIQRCFEDILGFNNMYLRITCSIGISVFPSEHAYDAESVLKCADIALEHAKNTGKNKYVFFEDSMIEELEQRRNLINALENSHMRDNFEVHYQRLHHQSASDSIYAEALLRWNWEGKSISPAKFIPIAEETGLIIPIGRMVLDEVCKDIAHMHALGIDFYASINVSAVQLLNPTFIHSVVQAVEAHCISPSFLTIEITETSLIHDTSLVKGKLEVLSSMGVKISLDDFGTGFSSLSHVLTLPINELKLDRTFIHDFDTDKKRQAVIKNVIALAHGMDIRVVAEGVENESENTLLEKYECDIIQGFYHAHPKPLAQLIEESTGLKLHPMSFKNIHTGA